MNSKQDEFLAGDFSNIDSAAEASPYISYLDSAKIAVQEIGDFGNQLLGLKPGDAVLDVGCGTGDALHDLLQIVGSRGRAVGVDASDAMIAEARTRAESRNSPITFTRCDASQLTFADNDFDACNAERLFLHLEHPARSLAEMARVVKPGGRILVREPDLEMVAFDSADHQTSRAILNFFMAKVRNGYVGRQLYGLFHQAGLSDVTVHARTWVINSLAVFNGGLPFEANALEAVKQGKADEGAVNALLGDLHRRDAEGRFFASGVLFLALGRKP